MLRRAARVGAGVALGGGALVLADPRARDALTAGGQGLPSADGVLRFTRTGWNALVTAVDYKYSLYGTDKDQDPVTYKAALHAANLRAAHRLYRVCHAHGGLYTKFGQGVANLNHALPAEFTDIMAPLQDRAREMAPELALQTLEEELGRPISEVFESFEPRPIAAASLAQVHRAVLKGSKEPVAVKIQYPYLKDQTAGDLATMRFLADFVGYWFPDFSYSWLAPEFENNMILELDFRQEARNGERLARMFAHRRDVKVPAIVWPLTSKRVLTMEFVESLKITNVDALEKVGINPLQVAETVSSVFGDMIHVHGFVHCDPHAGNLGVLPIKKSWFSSASSAFSAASYASIIPLTAAISLAGPGSAIALAGGACLIAVSTVAGVSALRAAMQDSKQTAAYDYSGNPYQLVVLDHGMYRRLTPEFRSSYCQLWKALLMRDIPLGKDAAVRLGVAPEQYDALSVLFTFRSSTSQDRTGVRMSKEERRRVRDQYKDVTAAQVNEFLQRLPRDLLFVSRSTNIVRSINLSLGGTSRSRFKIMGQSAVRGLLLPPVTEEMFREAMMKLDPELRTDVPYDINLPVASEIVDARTVTWRQAFEVWRLGTYVSLIDRSWAILASIVQWL